jgi:hypothetical protein
MFVVNALVIDHDWTEAMGDSRRLDSVVEPWPGTGDVEPRNGLHPEPERCRSARRDHDLLHGRRTGWSYRITVPARRTLHQRFNELKDPEPIPKATNYASTIVSDVPIVVQHTRLDSRQAENALITTIAFAGNE